MNEALKMYSQMTFEDSSSVTSLPESEDGAPLSGLQGGLTIDRSGLEVVPVSRSAEQEKAWDSLTHGIYGQYGNGSLQNLNLQLSLGQRMRTGWESNGLIPSKSTLKRLVTPLGRCYSRLALSAHHKRESGLILLPSPS